MCASHYIRHELLRHDSIREHTFTFKKFDFPQHISSCGFYFEPYSERIFCFSCHFSLGYLPSYKNLNELHRQWSPKCLYIAGKDVTIKSSIFQFNIECVGWPSVSSPSTLDYTSIFLQPKIGVNHIPLRHIRYKCRNLRLPQFQAITRIPEHYQDNRVMDVEYFFSIMSNYKLRLQTYNVDGYRFPFSDKLAKELANSGMIYTLFGGAVQCVYCRKVFSGSINTLDLDVFHRWNSSSCKFLTMRNSSDFDEHDVIPEVNVQNMDLEYDARCLICLTNCRQIFSYPCMHLTHCLKCFNENRPDSCIVCREPHVKYHKVYVT